MTRDTISLEELAGVVLEDKYRLIRVLGSGAMAHVYEAEQLRLGRSVAVKVMRATLVSDKKSLERFQTEGLAASRINHPHAIAIYDLGVTRDGIPYLVMERLVGRTLTAVLGEGKLTPERIAGIGAQILAALEEAHTCGVIHRDLKSDNIILSTRRDGSDFVKVLDFGIASFVDRPDRSIVGTPEYMSPEAIRGLPPTISVDIYSMGVLLYEMIVGRTPFAGTTSITTVLSRHLNEAAPAPASIVASCPAALSDLVVRALDKDPSKRFASAREMREALLGVLGSGTRMCSACGEKVPASARWCTMCGLDRGDGTSPGTPAPVPEAAAVAPARLTMPFGSGVVAELRVRPEKRPSRLTAELAAARALAGAGDDEPTVVKRDPFIGRDAELARIGGFLAGSEASTGLTITGAEGCGKARLVLEAGRRLPEGNVMFIAGPDPSGHQQSWYPVLSMISAVLAIPARPTWEEVVAGAARVGLPERDAPGLCELFGIAGPLGPLELAVRRRETYAATVRALAAVGQRYPRAVLCFIDVDRYDLPTRKLIDALVLALPQTVRMICTTTHPDAVPAGTAVMPLAGLSMEDAHALLERSAGSERALGISAAKLFELSAGNPAVVLQLGGWLSTGNDAAEAPPRLVDLVGARLGQLPAAARRVLQLLAVHGQVISRRIAGALVAKLDPTGAALAVLERAGLVTSTREDFTIPFEMVARVAEAATPADARRALSRAVLQKAQSAPRPGDTLAPAVRATLELSMVEVAHHAEAIGDLERALQAFVAAGDDAVRRFDDPRAASLYHRAINLARQRASADMRAGAQVVSLSLRLADVLRYMGQVSLAVGCLDEAEQFEPAEGQRAGIARGRGRIALMQGNAIAAVSLFRKAIGGALRTGDTEFLCDTYIDLSNALSTLGNVAEAASELAEAVDTLTLGDGLARAEGPPRLWVLGLRLAAMQLRAKNLVAAKQAAKDSLAQAERAGSATGQGRLHAMLASILESGGETHAALVHQAHALDHMRRLGDRRSTAELLLACARMTGDLPPIIATGSRKSEEASRRSRDTARKALAVANELAAEIGWDEKLSPGRGAGVA